MGWAMSVGKKTAVRWGLALIAGLMSFQLAGRNSQFMVQFRVEASCQNVTLDQLMSTPEYAGVRILQCGGPDVLKVSASTLQDPAHLAKEHGRSAAGLDVLMVEF